MKRRIFSGFLKWFLLLFLVLGTLITGITARDPTLHLLSYLQNGSAWVCRLIWDIPSNGLSFSQVQRQLSLVGMNYMAPNLEIISFSNWFQHLPQRLLTSQLHALAASEEVESEDPSTPKEEKENFITDPESPISSGVDVQDFLRDHESTPVVSPLSSNTVADGQTRIVLYCTHNSESYTPSSGGTHVSGGNGLINNVATHLAEQLTQKGLPSEFVFGMHDWPSYDNSYTESRKTVNQILEKYPDQLVALFDVHRDSILSQKKADTVEINHRKAARILLVVGTNQRKSHPNWEQNLALAQKIETVGNQLYPGLIRGITQKAGTYHQELFTGALLLEFGTDLNSLEEAEYAAELLADILVQVFST